jgi:hypothetical protein
MVEFWKIASIFLTSLIGFTKIAVPSATALFGFNALKVLLITCSGSITGVILFTNISAVFLKWFHRIKVKYFNSHEHPKIFTKSNRRIIKVKKRFGLWGIAFVTPLGITIPLGAFIAERFYKDKKQVILALSIGVLFWNITIYVLLAFFYESIKRFL